MVAVADAFDAMTSTRSYRRARPVPAALEELERCAGAQFDPRMVRGAGRAALDRHGWHPAGDGRTRTGAVRERAGAHGAGGRGGRSPAGSTGRRGPACGPGAGRDGAGGRPVATAGPAARERGRRDRPRVRPRPGPDARGRRCPAVHGPPVRSASLALGHTLWARPRRARDRARLRGADRGRASWPAGGGGGGPGDGRPRRSAPPERSRTPCSARTAGSPRTTAPPRSSPSSSRPPSSAVVPHVARGRGPAARPSRPPGPDRRLRRRLLPAALQHRDAGHLGRPRAGLRRSSCSRCSRSPRCATPCSPRRWRTPVPAGRSGRCCATSCGPCSASGRRSAPPGR